MEERLLHVVERLLEKRDKFIWENQDVKWKIGSSFLRGLESQTCLIPITEGKLETIFNRHRDSGFIIISGNRANRNREDNNRYNNLLVDLIRKHHKFQYIPLWGGYLEDGANTAEPEPSYMVFPKKIYSDEDSDGTVNVVDADFDELLEFGKKVLETTMPSELVTDVEDDEPGFSQETIMVFYPNDYHDENMAGRVVWLDKDGNITKFENKTTWNDMSKEYWTQDRRRGRGGTSQYKRWMRNKNPWATNSKAKLGDRFSVDMEDQSNGDDSVKESYAYFLEFPPETYNTKWYRKMSGCDESVYDLL